MVNLVKAHAYGNDFLLAPETEVSGRALDALARAACDRHRGVGADGLIVYAPTPGGARMHLFNADGSRAEVSGNGVRCLAALLAWQGSVADHLVIETQAGPKTLVLLARAGDRFTFRAAMGPPTDVRHLDLVVNGAPTPVVAMTVGNPQAVVLGGPLDEGRLARVGPALATHPAFPAGTNVELAEVEAPDRIRILIWERGVGPTRSSGTGACAAVVAGALFGGAARTVDVVAPGGAQRVEWREEGLYLTGWAELVWEGRYLG